MNDENKPQPTDAPIACLPLICPHCGEAGFENALQVLNHVGDHVADLTIRENDFQEQVRHQRILINYLAGWVVELYDALRSDGYGNSQDPWTVHAVLQEAEENIQ